MTVSVAQRSFTGGEFAPGLYSRVDLEKYPTAVRTMRNVFPHPHGGASNRGGTEFVCEVKDSSAVTRLVPFQFSTEQAYVLEFGNNYIRVMKDGGRVVEGDVSISGATQANPVVITATGHGYSDGDWVVISGVGGMTELNGKTFVVNNKTTNDFELTDVDGNDIDGTGYTAYTSGGVCNKVYEITTTYATADLSLLKFVQSADVLYITHPDYAPATLSRTGHTSWTLSTITFGADIVAPTGVSNSGTGSDNVYAVTVVSTDGEESEPSDTVSASQGDTITWDTVTGSDYFNVYQVKSGVYGYLGQAAEETYDIESDLDPDMTDTAPQARDPFDGADDYPGVSTFFEQRWVAARTNNDPQTIWGSVVGSFANMNVRSPLQDDDAYNFTLNSMQVNEIRWLVPMNDLIIGTSGSEWKMSDGSNSDAVTPTSVSMRMQSRWGVSDVPPIVIGNSIVFIEASGEVVRDLMYSLDVDGYTGNDLSIMAKHLLEGFTIDSWAFQQSPNTIIWCVRSDGTLLGLTYHKEHQIWGWHHHDTEGDFESVTSIRTSDGVDEVYTIVERTIDGSTRRYVEKLRDRLPIDDNGSVSVQDAFFVDCGLSLDNPLTITGATQANPVVITSASHGLSNGDYVDIVEVEGMTELNDTRYKVANVATDTFELTDESDNDIDGTGYSEYLTGGEVRECVTTISGLDHLEGEDVAVLSNGSVVSGKTVSSGSITLPLRASRVHIGLAYTSDLETLDFEYQTETGTLQDKKRDINSVLLELLNTRALQVGPDEDNLSEILFREDEAYGQATALYTGDKEEPIYASDDQRQGRLFIRNTDPLPFTVLGIIVRMEHGES